MRAVSFEPFSPTSGEVLMPIVIERLGSSTRISGSARGSSGSASVSPIVTSGRPATAMISPGPASSASVRSSASVTYSSVTLTRSISPSERHQAICWPRVMTPCMTRQMARRPTYGDASRFVTSACSGCSGSCTGAGMCSSSVWKSGSRSSARSSGPVFDALALAGVAVDDRELDLVVARVEVEEQRVRLVDDLGDARIRPVDLVHDQDHLEVRLERLAQHEARLRQRPLAGVDQQQHAVDHRQRALHLAAEVGVARACRRC